MRKKNPTDNSVDLYIGQRLQLRRNMIGLTQKDLADLCGVSFQQIQKYETAFNRISASRLFQIGMALDTPVAFFFSGLPKQDHTPEMAPHDSRVRKTKACSPNDDPLAKNESLELINLYWRLPNDDVRETVRRLLKSIVYPA